MLVKNPKPLLQTLSALAIAACGISWSETRAAVVGPGTIHTVTLAWDAVPETDILGYKVHVGTQPGQYTETLDAGTALSFDVPGLVYGQTYYFSVRTVGADGLESGYSPELTLSVSLPSLPATAGLVSTGTGPTGLQWSYPISGLTSYPDFIIESSTDLINWAPAGTVPLDGSTGSTATHLTYSFPITPDGPQRFYRLTSRNWLGDSTAP